MKYRCLLILAALSVARVAAGTVEGNVTGATTGEPIPLVTVRVVGSGQSILANEQGRFRIALKDGNHQLKFSHVAHYSRILDIWVGDSVTVLNIELEPALVEVAPIRVYERAYDAAQRIIIEAIRRKEELLTRIRQYDFDAYTKLVLRKTNKDDSINIFLITETQVEVTWRYPDDYKEIITARRQSSNLKAEQNLVSVGEILNFNKNRIDFGGVAVVSPTAKDALDYYNYYLIDTIYNDAAPVFVLEIEPKSKTTALFVGTIKIADSSFAVVGVDVGLNEAFESLFLYEPRYRQVHSQFDSEYWMPTMIQFDGRLDFGFPGIPELTLEYTAALQNYNFDDTTNEVEFDEFALEVALTADDVDSTDWLTGQLMPLTDEETDGYERIDSLKNAPKPIHKQILSLVPTVIAFAVESQDFFHFNRVEGAYVGLGKTFNRIGDRLTLRLKSGYAIDANLWQHCYGVNYLLSEKQDLTFDFEYRDEIRTWTTIQSRPDGNATFFALMQKTDPYDYYREKGFAATLKTKLVNHTRLALSYTDVEQTWQDTSTSYGLFGDNAAHRFNPVIVDGRLRSVGLDFSYDSRKLIKDRGRLMKMYSLPFTIFQAGVEYTTDDVLGSDFDFTRYHAALYREQRLPGLGTTSLSLFGGTFRGTVPPQKFWVVDLDAQLVDKVTYFYTMRDHNFYGSRVLSVYAQHDFGTRLFKKSHLPLIEKIPYHLSVHGGAFWTDFRGNAPQPGDDLLPPAIAAYSELGFGLTGFLPLGLGLNFTWQLSHYDTSPFSIDVAGRF